MAESEGGRTESVDAFGGACESLNRVNSALLPSSFFARAAAVSKVKPEALESALGADAVVVTALGWVEPEANTRPEPAV